MKVFYFGCWGQPGHYARAAGTAKRYSAEEHEFCEKNPWGYEIDGGLCPKGPEIQGRALVHHKDGWTAMCFCDRSVDKRGKCNSGFFAEGTWSFSAMLEIAKKHFPEVISRLEFDVVEHGS